MTSQKRSFFALCTSIFLAGFGIFLWCAIFSYNASDPSLNRLTFENPANWMGAVGARYADPLMQVFGMASYVIAFLCFGFSYRIFLILKPNWLSVKIALAILLVICSSALCSAFITDEKWPFYVGYGGLIGDFLIPFFKNFIPSSSFFLSSILLLCIISVFTFIFACATGITWEEVRKIAAWIWYGISVSSILFWNICCWIHRRFFVKEKTEAEGEEEDEIEEENSEPLVAIPKKQKKRRRAPLQQASLPLRDRYDLPDISLLAAPDNKKKKNTASESSLSQNARLLEQVLEDFNVQGNIIRVRPGPVVTLYELEPSPGTKSSRVIGLSDDISRSMSSISARIAVISGRNAIGIELPNAQRETVYLRELLESDEYADERVKLPLTLGKNIGGDPVVADLARMPHVLVAGTTGSGKSVGINAMILSLVYRLSPDECRFIMIDPKMLELSIYDGIPHLLTPVVTEPGKAVVALKWAVKEMEQRYRLMSTLNVRNIASYNKAIEEAIARGKTLERTIQTGFNPASGEPVFETVPIDMVKLPFIVVIVDEMADLMLVAGKDIEASIQRLAQMARAAGIHLIMATQRPSVDVITGVIKANFPTRISFQVTSKIDSRTILGEQGAEQLLGMGDMLYMAGGGRIIRVHGAFVDDREVEDVVAYLKTQGTPSYLEDVTAEPEDDGSSVGGDSGNGDLYSQAVAIVQRDKKASTSYLQRQLKIGYNRAADLIDRMEREGIISQPNHIGRREVL